MPANVMQAIHQVSNELHISHDALLQESLKLYLETRLRQIKSEIYKLYGKYQVTSVEALESRFEDGSLEEKDALDDYHRLDHLEYKRDELIRFLATLC